MPIIKTINKDILEAFDNTDEPQVICQQCNCVTLISHGLSEQIASKFPWANVYGRRKMKTRNTTSEPSKPGTIQVDRDNGKSVIHLFAQVLPGKPGSYSKYYSNKEPDGPQDRIKYFKECLEQLDQLNLDQVAIPYKIGCGLAGGDWLVYEKMLRDCKTNVVLYRM